MINELPKNKNSNKKMPYMSAVLDYMNLKETASARVERC